MYGCILDRIYLLAATGNSNEITRFTGDSCQDIWLLKSYRCLDAEKNIPAKTEMPIGIQWNEHVIVVVVPVTETDGVNIRCKCTVV